MRRLRVVGAVVLVVLGGIFLGGALSRLINDASTAAKVDEVAAQNRNARRRLARIECLIEQQAELLVDGVIVLLDDSDDQAVAALRAQLELIQTSLAGVCADKGAS